MTKPDDLGARSAPTMLPATDCELLTGIRQIALWLGISPGQTRQRISAGIIPTFRVKGCTCVYALKSEINSRASELFRDRAINHRLQGKA